MAEQLYGLTQAQLSRIGAVVNRIERTPRGPGPGGPSRYRGNDSQILMGVLASTVKYDTSISPSYYPGTFNIWNAVEPSDDSTFAVEDTNYSSTGGIEGGEDSHSEYPLEVWPWCFSDCSELTAGHQIVAAYMGGRWWIIQADACPTQITCGVY